MRNRRALPIALALCTLCLAAAPAPDTAPTIDALLGSERVRIPVAALAERVRLAPDQDFRVVEIGRDAGTSHHVAAVRAAEKPHRHDHHDQLVMIARGHGTMRIGDDSRPVGEGSFLYVPRGTVHAFANTSGEPSVAYVVYSPPFDGADRVEVGQISSR
jgi:mannose-6-phosphate isomerase-like protein (cupin superfamily)